MHVGPHVPDVLALWAVLCRLEKVVGWESLDETTLKDIQAMTSMEKAILYAHGVIPGRFSREAVNEVRSSIPTLCEERINHEHYEGRYGASPRELKGYCSARPGTQRTL